MIKSSDVKASTNAPLSEYKGDAGNHPDLLAKYVDEPKAKSKTKTIWNADIFKSVLLSLPPEKEYCHVSQGTQEAPLIYFVQNGDVQGYLSPGEYKEVKFKRHVCGEMQDIAGILGDHPDEAVERLLKLEKELAGYLGLPVD